MRNNLLKFLFLTLPLLLLGDHCFSQNSSVVINEINWMGTDAGYTKEWIELYNPTNFPVKLDGWKLVDKYGKVNIKLKGNIPPFSFFLLERTSDDTLPEIQADMIYTGALKNSGGNLVLLDASGRIIDQVNCANGWFAGDNKTKRTMERINPKLSGSDPKNWQTSIYPKGTPKRKNYIPSLVASSKNRQEKEANPQVTNPAQPIDNSFPFKFLLASIGSFSLTFFFLKIKLKKEPN